jgi:rhodanese-related sulfurtransferase
MTSTTQIPTSVSPAQAADLASNGARILDVRTTGEFDSVHIPGSYNVPLDLLSEHRGEFTRSVDQPVILVCASGMRARQADNSLRDAGLDSVSVLEGGIAAWETQGQPVIKGQQKWSLERQVRLVAGSLVAIGALGGLLFWRPLTLLSLFVGGGLTFAGITNTCGMAMLLARLPYNQGQKCDVHKVINELSADTRS